MNGTDCVNQALEIGEAILTDVGSSPQALALGTQGEDLRKSLAELGQVRNKATLRTRNGANLAFPVLDAAQNLKAAWEEAAGGADQGELKARAEEFAMAVGTLCAALKERTVIMT